MPADQHSLTFDHAERLLVGRIIELMECNMLRIKLVHALPVWAGLLGLAACEHPRALPSGPSPRAEAVGLSATTVDIAALHRAAAALASDPATVGAAGQVVAELQEAKNLAARPDAEFWARLEATARAQPALPVPPR
jgi:hypothetical protein